LESVEIYAEEYDSGYETYKSVYESELLALKLLFQKILRNYLLLKSDMFKNVKIENYIPVPGFLF
jgi:hypothetical protein